MNHLVSLAALLMLLLAVTTPGYAEYTCGPHLTTYSVSAPGAGPAQGVRCVLFVGSDLILDSLLNYLFSKLRVA